MTTVEGCFQVTPFIDIWFGANAENFSRPDLMRGLCIHGPGGVQLGIGGKTVRASLCPKFNCPTTSPTASG